MEPELKKLFSNAKRKIHRKSKRELMFRYKKYMGYSQLFSSSNNEGIKKVYEFLKKDAAAYMAPAVLSFASCKLKPHTLKDKELDFMELPSLVSFVSDSVNASILLAVRILLDRTSFYMHTAYNSCEIGNGIGSIEGNKKTGVMKFIDKHLTSSTGLTEEERRFFKYILKEHDEWFHEVVQVNNKTKHNLSAYELYEIGINNMPTVILSSAKRYYKDKELTVEKDVPIDFETKYVSRAYDLFDKILEFTTSIIVSRENKTENYYGKG